MAKIDFPKPLKDLLEDSKFQPPIRSLADRVGQILSDNKLPFFPDYTDHGVDHINAVLNTAVELVPGHVWEQSKKDSRPRLLCDADAAVLIGAVLLHDIAMHLRPAGFLQLVGENSRFRPLPWFKANQEGHSADRSWQELWGDYVREARRFSDRQLTNIIGEDSARRWKFEGLPDDTGQWELNHNLIVGEFIRRHHARLAHEIATYGFPGAELGPGADQFPGMGTEKGHPLRQLADLIGLTARSHGTTLRVCKAYLEASPQYVGTPRPMGTAVLYPMALLRVADYLQIDGQRAPSVLLQLRNPQSPISVQEWAKHRAVKYVGPANDPRGKVVTVSPEVSLSVYLQLRELLAGLQAEMDHSTAVLDEAYGTLSGLGLDQLTLAIRRVYSNLHSPAFRHSLPYVPDQTGFTADPNLLTLLVQPLYGNNPGVGVRELMQNAVDAVRELEAWCNAHHVGKDSLDLPKQEADVLIDFIKHDDGSWFLRVQDRGIGMTSDTIQNYFLRAGASFRRSVEWEKEFLDDKGHSRVLRSGRFGIGAFAVFLLGSSFKLRTRHAGADKSMGYTIKASASSQLIEIRRTDDLHVGTTIEVEVSSESAAALGLDHEEYTDYRGPAAITDWFCWDWPRVVRRVNRGAKPEVLGQTYTCPVRDGNLPLEWARIHPAGFDAVYWSFGEAPSLSCNGLNIEDPNYNPLTQTAEFEWPEAAQLDPPCIAVLDSAANLPLTIRRDGLSERTVPFIDEVVRDVLLSFIAHALVCGPTSQIEALSTARRHPLHAYPISEPRGSHSIESVLASGCMRWCASSKVMVPSDPWLYTLLDHDTCIVYGQLSRTGLQVGLRSSRRPLKRFPDALLKQEGASGHAALAWRGVADSRDGVRFIQDVLLVLGAVARKGVNFLGPASKASRVCLSFGQGDKIVRDMEMFENQGDVEKSLLALWNKIPRHENVSPLFTAQTGSVIWNNAMESLFEEWEAACRFGRDSRWLPFVAEIRPVGTSSPESMIAKIWNECLGARSIPFDPDARNALIEDGSKHPELKRHIEAWKEMKRTGSKWVTGD